jgi:hypothetical protein
LACVGQAFLPAMRDRFTVTEKNTPATRPDYSDFKNTLPGIKVATVVPDGHLIRGDRDDRRYPHADPGYVSVNARCVSAKAISHEQPYTASHIES